MNNYYFLSIIGFIAAQAFMASLMVYLYQKEKDIKYGSALKIYFDAEIGWFVIALCGLFVVLFILPDIINLDIKKEDLKNKVVISWKEKAQLYFRLTVVFVGAFVQYIGFKFRKTGKAAIDKAVDGVG